MEKVYSNRIWITYLIYIEKHHGKHVLDAILAEAGTDRLELSDSGGFQSKEFSNRISLAAIKHTGIEDISYRVGRSFIESVGRVGGTMLGLTSPYLCMKLLAQVEGRLALKTMVLSEPDGKNRHRIRVSFRDGFQETVYACQNRIGSYEAIPRVFGLPYAEVEHPRCAFNGGDCCEYRVTLPEYGFLLFKKAALFLGILGVTVGGMILSGLMRASLDWIAYALLFGGLAAYAEFKHQQAASSLEWTLLANDSLTAQNTELEKNNTQVRAVQELTLALGRALRMQAICDLVVTTLVKDFKYGSSQIWILNGNGIELAFRAADGYPSGLDARIRSPDPRARGEANPYGLLAEVLQRGKTLVVNDLEDGMADMGAPAKQFYLSLDPSSFMVTPLFQGDAPIGVMTVEHSNGKRLDQKDKLFFQSIANVAAGALVKAALFEQMAEKIRQLQVAKEMAIQSEKLSSLGQMVAGVAHEISNPLNFLTNIMPDVRHDVEGLGKLRQLALSGGLSGETAALFKSVDEEYDLDSHLADQSFVFDKIKKALDKSTQIAKSLKVFSRSSAKEAVTRESFAGMIKDVLDLIPGKVRGQTAIRVDIPDELAWQVNKNEMEQAFLAIINNAIDALEQKGNLEIAGKTFLGDILITFRDDGPGIPDSVRERIFEAFYTTKPAGKGTGLGLSIAVEIVRKYGGSLAVESAPGKGTTFIFRFPKPVV
jgi:signal transduction histidine kinase